MRRSLKMTIYKHPIVQDIISSRKNLIELIVVAILIAFGINLIAGQIIALTIVNPFVTALLGFILIFSSMLYLATSLLGGRIKSHTFEAFLIYNVTENEIIPVPRYEFSEDIHSYLKSAFEENSALNTLWKKEPLRTFHDRDQIDISKHKSVQLLLESVQYFLLSKLSTHLTDYFATENFKKSNLKKYERKDIPEILLNNRFLELFSRPMEQRPAFMEEYQLEDDESSGEVVYAFGSKGEIYDKFDLVLPQKSSIRRPDNNKIEIETEKLKISMVVHFEGFNTLLPRMFEEYYLGINNSNEYRVYQLDICIHVLMKLRSLFSNAGWEYYHWIDSYLDNIEKEVSKDDFFERINWENICTILQCLNLKQAKGKSHK